VASTQLSVTSQLEIRFCFSLTFHFFIIRVYNRLNLPKIVRLSATVLVRNESAYIFYKQRVLITTGWIFPLHDPLIQVKLSLSPCALKMSCTCLKQPLSRRKYWGSAWKFIARLFYFKIFLILFSLCLLWLLICSTVGNQWAYVLTLKPSYLTFFWCYRIIFYIRTLQGWL
jgi:hypothetical protein